MRKKRGNPKPSPLAYTLLLKKTLKNPKQKNQPPLLTIKTPQPTLKQQKTPTNLKTTKNPNPHAMLQEN